MTPPVALISSALCAFLLGSIPFGYLVARMRGVDIRQLGSGNIGATNVFRFVGKGWGLLVFALDALKGVIAVLVAGRFGGGSPGLILAALGAILGHNFTPWLGFKGGKGIATSAGVFLALTPVAALVALGVWGLVVILTKYVSLASIVAALALPAAIFFLPPGGQRDYWLFGFGAVAALLAVWRHRSNIRRLIDGTEHRFGRPRDAA